MTGEIMWFIDDYYCKILVIFLCKKSNGYQEVDSLPRYRNSMKTPWEIDKRKAFKS